MKNLWDITAPAPDKFPRFSGTVRADVAIIGAGFTGLSAALHLAEAGKKVVVLEARQAGYGGSGRNAGLLNAGLWTPPDEVEAQLGTEAGQKLNAALAGAPALVMALVEAHGIECELKKNGTLHCAHSPGGFAALKDRYSQQKARKAPVTLLEREEAAERIGSNRFFGALHDARAGTLQPLGYARGLARTAAKAGAEVFEDSEVTGTTRDTDRWRITTREGEVCATHLIEATNGYECSISEPRYTPLYYFQCATDPIPASERAGILSGGEGCWDTALVMSSFRLDAAGRLIIGAVGRLDGPGSGVHLNWASRKLAQIFPDLGARTFTCGWHGRIAMTSDHLPKVMETGENAISVFGYSGRGIGPGTVFGKAAADYVLSGDKTVFPVAMCKSWREKRTGLMERWYQAGAILTHLTGARR